MAEYFLQYLFLLLNILNIKSDIDKEFKLLYIIMLAKFNYVMWNDLEISMRESYINFWKIITRKMYIAGKVYSLNLN